MDLLSQGISIQNVAQIASKAAYGAILVLSSVPDLPGTIDGLEPRPGLALAVPKNVSVAFSSSSKVPLSRVDALTRQVAADLVEVAREQKLSLSALINAASGGGIGLTYGAVPDVLLGLAAGQDKPRRQIGTSETEQAAQARRDQ